MSPPCVVLVHGSQCDRRVWGPVLRHRPQHARVSLLDLPDHGASPDASSPAVEPLVEALVEHVRALPDPEVTLVGHSLGAYVSCRALPKLGARVSAAIFVSGLDYLRPADMVPYQLMRRGLERDRLDLDLLREASLDAFLGVQHRRPEHDALLMSMQDMSRERVLRSLARGEELGEPVPRYDTPATVIHGREDASIRYELGVSLAGRGSRAELVTLETDSHMPHLTHPERVAELVFG